MAGQPWFKFSPAAWKADTALRACSLAARAIWLEMLCIMHEADPRGHLVVNGAAVTEPAKLARLIGGDAEECADGLAELLAAGIYSTTADGVIFSRRMVKDTRISEEQRQRALGGSRSDKTKKNGTGEAVGNAGLEAGGEADGKAVGAAKNKEKRDKKESSLRSESSEKLIEDIWAIAGKQSRNRSNKHDLGKAVDAALKRGGDPEQMLSAMKSYFAETEDQFAKGVHRMIEADRWKDRVPAEQRATSNGHDEVEEFWRGGSEAAADLMVRAFRETGEWNRHAGPTPAEQGCRAPEAILTRHGFGEQSSVPAEFT